MTHIGIQQTLEGENVDWMAQVSDEDTASECASAVAVSNAGAPG
jgi:hypothetical protein